MCTGLSKFNFPDNYHVATAAAIGFYGGNPELLDDDLEKAEREQKRERKPQEEFIFNADFKG